VVRPNCRRNADNRNDPPTFWLGFRPPAEWACQILDTIVTVTGADQATVEQAMGDSPYVRIRPDTSTHSTTEHLFDIARDYFTPDLSPPS
jgi:hypothetical protein